jgi:yecA family protein
MTHELFSYDEADAILRLDGANDYVGISAIDGLIAAVVAGPAAMEPSVWLPEVFGKTPLQTPGTPQHRLMRTVLHRHDEVREILAHRPHAYLPIFMRDQGQIYTEDWTIGFMLGVGMRDKAWTRILTSSFRAALAPIFSVHPIGRQLMPDVPDAELDKIKETAYDTIGPAVVALHKHCASDQAASRRLAKLRTSRRR